MYLRFNFRTIIVILFLSTLNLLNAQTALNPYALDLDFLSQSIKKRVDLVRISNGFNKLHFEPHLNKAAFIQADYLKTEKEISHSNRNPSYKTVSKRILTTGVKDFSCAENIARYNLGTTYESTADSIVKGWVNSTGHFQNIIGVNHFWTGISITTTEIGEITIVQVFSSKGTNFTKEVFDNNPPIEKSEVLPFNIKGLDENFFTESVINKAMLSSGGYRIKSLNTPAVKRLFQGPKDGIVFELVLNSQVNCSTNIYDNFFSRRNKNSSVNGRLYFPHYSKELLEKKNFRKTENEFKKDKQKRLKELQKKIIKTKRNIIQDKRNYTRFNSSGKESDPFKADSTKHILTARENSLAFYNKNLNLLKNEKWNPRIWEYDFSQDIIYSPEEISEVNILYLKNNKITFPLYYKSVKYNGIYKDSITDLIEWEFDKPTIKVYNIFHSKKLKIYYDRSSYKLDESTKKDFKSKLSNFIVKSAAIDIIASVEGSEEINDKLFELRKKEFQKFFKSILPKGVKPYFTAKENWPLFYYQIKKDSTYSHLIKYPKDSIRTLLVGYSNNEPWNSYLKKQRLAKIEVFGELEVADTLGYLSETYNFKSNRQLKMVQDFIIEQILNGDMGMKNIDRLTFNRKQLGLSSLILDKYLFKYIVGISEPDFKTENFLINFRSEIEPKIASDTLLFTYLKLRMKHWKKSKHGFSSNADVFLELYKRGYNTKSMAIFALKAMPHYNDYISGKVRLYNSEYYGFQAFNFEFPNSIFSYYKNDSVFKLERENWNNLIQYFIGYNKYGYANQLINLYSIENGYDVDFRFMQMVINYQHPFYDNGGHAQELMKELPLMGNEKWCEFFYGEYAPSFQIFDWKPIWEMYCQECSK